MNHYDQNYAANLDRDDDDDEVMALCEKCEDASAWNPLVDGRNVCVGCAFDLLDEFIRERDGKAAAGPATREIMEVFAHVMRGLNHSRQVVISCGGNSHSVTASTVDAFLDEQEAKP